MIVCWHVSQKRVPNSVALFFTQLDLSLLWFRLFVRANFALTLFGFPILFFSIVALLLLWWSKALLSVVSSHFNSLKDFLFNQQVQIVVGL
jgi:hypothetical protein